MGTRRALIRALFGDRSKNKYPFHRSSIDAHIRGRLMDKYASPFVTYVLGLDNFKQLSKMGVNCVLVDEKPLLANHSLVNKIVLLEAAMKDYDEVVLLDWDCAPTTYLPNDFWTILGKKEVIQCPLYKCPRRVNTWRNGRIPPKLLSAGFFVYLRDKNIPSILLKWGDKVELPNKWSDETYYSKYIDELMGGWEGETKDSYNMNKYLKYFDPLICGHLKSCFREYKTNTCFYHPVKHGPIL
jgi:hypothetical protein